MTDTERDDLIAYAETCERLAFGLMVERYGSDVQGANVYAMRAQHRVSHLLGPLPHQRTVTAYRDPGLERNESGAVVF